MDLRNLKKLLNEDLELEQFLSGIKREVLEYKVSVSSGSPISKIACSDSTDYLSFSNKDLEKLLMLYINDKIFEWELEYILNVIELCDLDLPTKSEEIIYYLSTPEINLKITKGTVQNCIDYLNNKSIHIPVGQKRDYNEKYWREHRTVFMPLNNE